MGWLEELEQLRQEQIRQPVKPVQPMLRLPMPESMPPGFTDRPTSAQSDDDVDSERGVFIIDM